MTDTQLPAPARLSSYTPWAPSERYQRQQAHFGEGGPADDAALTLRDVLTVLFRYKRLVLLCFFVVTGTVTAALILFPRTYVASATVLVRTDAQATPSFFADVSAYRDRRMPDPVDRRIETEIQILQSGALANRTVRDLGLSYEQVYHGPKQYFSTPLLEVVDRVREALGSAWARVMGDDPPPRRPSRRGPSAVVEGVQQAINVSALKSKGAESNSNIIEIGLIGPDSAITRAALARLVEHYVAFDRELGDVEGRRAESIVRTELSDAERELRDADRALQTFLARTNRSSQRTTGIPGSESVAAQYQIATTPRDEASLALLKQELIERELELLDLRETYLDSSERVQSLRREVEALRGRIEAEVLASAANYAAQNDLERRLGAAERRFAELQRRLREIALYLQVNALSNGARVVLGPATIIRATRKSTLAAIAFAGAIAGLGLGLVLAGFLAYCDQTLSGVGDVKRHLGLAVAAVVPVAITRPRGFGRQRPHRANGKAPTEARVDSVVRVLAARTLGVLRARQSGVASSRGATVLVTSARRGEGTSFVATAIASELSRLGCGRILLIDASTSAYDDGAAVRSAAPPARAARAEDNIGARPQSPGDGDGAFATMHVGNDAGALQVLNPQRVEDLLGDVTRDHDVVVIDGGSVQSGAPILLARAVDVLLVVVEARATRRQVVRRALDQLTVAPDTPTAVVLNRARHEIPEALYARL